MEKTVEKNKNFAATQRELFSASEDEKAVFSVCRSFRYTLFRRFGADACFVQYIGLNPSTADETRDDHTIRKLRTFTKNLGFDAFCMTNLFAFRATSPAVMKKQFDPVGHANDEWLLKIAGKASLIVACWGVHGVHRSRDAVVRHSLRNKNLMCFGVTSDGLPRHPLMLPYSTQLEKFK